MVSWLLLLLRLLLWKLWPLLLDPLLLLGPIFLAAIGRNPIGGRRSCAPSTAAAASAAPTAS